MKLQFLAVLIQKFRATIEAFLNCNIRIKCDTKINQVFLIQGNFLVSRKDLQALT